MFFIHFDKGDLVRLMKFYIDLNQEYGIVYVKNVTFRNRKEITDI